MRTTKTFREARERLKRLLAELASINLPEEPKILGFLANTPAGALVSTCSDTGPMRLFPSQRGMHCAPDAFLNWHKGRQCYYLKPLKTFTKSAGEGSTDEQTLLTLCREVNDFIIGLRGWLKAPYPLRAQEAFYSPIRADGSPDPQSLPERYRWAYTTLDGRAARRIAHETTLKESPSAPGTINLWIANIIVLVRYTPEYYSIEELRTNSAIVARINQFTDYPVEVYEVEPGVKILRFMESKRPVVLGEKIPYKQRDEGGE
jgi:hypothetical protein